MTHDELRLAARAYLATAFKGDTTLLTPVIQAAVTIALASKPERFDDK